MVSEVMLQQTQVPRVIPKYNMFVEEFPNVKVLADASFTQVLRAWNGLGYNRRAKFLHESSKTIMQDYGGLVPQNIQELVSLKGVGHNTAAAICVYAFNQSHVFIETNTRTVFIYHFFKNQQQVSDKEIATILAHCLEKNHSMSSRDFYWALMDYGTYLKQTTKLNNRSKHYIKQSKFAGSLRQLRGQILRQLTTNEMTVQQLRTSIDDDRLGQALESLQTDKLITCSKGYWQLED